MQARIFAVMASLGFIASLLVHVATYIGYTVSQHTGFVWLLHVGVFFVFGPAVIAVSSLAKSGRLANVLRAYPPAVIILAVVIHFSASAAGMAAFARVEGSAEHRPGGYVLVNHGEFIRELSRAEFDAAKAAQDRLFSAIWLSFYGVSALFWWFYRAEDEQPN